MTDVFLERTFDPPVGRQDVIDMALQGMECFMLHRVDWVCSMLAADGKRMVCWFRGPDVESARTALRQVGAEVEVLWRGTVYEPADPPVHDPGAAQVLVQRRFDEPVTLESVQAMEEANGWCLEVHNVRFLRTFFSRDGTRMLCLYQAPDAESVRLAQRQAGLPLESVWPYRYVHPTFTAPPPA